MNWMPFLSSADEWTLQALKGGSYSCLRCLSLRTAWGCGPVGMPHWCKATLRSLAPASARPLSLLSCMQLWALTLKRGWLRGATTRQVMRNQDFSLSVQLSSGIYSHTYWVSGIILSALYVLTHLLLETISIPFYKWANWGREVLSKITKVWRRRIQTQAVSYCIHSGIPCFYLLGEGVTASAGSLMPRTYYSGIKRTLSSYGFNSGLDAATWQ